MRPLRRETALIHRVIATPPCIRRRSRKGPPWTITLLLATIKQRDFDPVEFSVICFFRLAVKKF